MLSVSNYYFCENVDYAQARIYKGQRYILRVTVAENFRALALVDAKPLTLIKTNVVFFCLSRLSVHKILVVGQI